MLLSRSLSLVRLFLPLVTLAISLVPCVLVLPSKVVVLLPVVVMTCVVLLLVGRMIVSLIVLCIPLTLMDPLAHMCRVCALLLSLTVGWQFTCFLRQLLSLPRTSRQKSWGYTRPQPNCLLRTGANGMRTRLWVGALLPNILLPRMQLFTTPLTLNPPDRH